MGRCFVQMKAAAAAAEQRVTPNHTTLPALTASCSFFFHYASLAPTEAPASSNLSVPAAGLGTLAVIGLVCDLGRRSVRARLPCADRGDELRTDV